MSCFREFEKKAVRLLALGALGNDVVVAVLEQGELAAYVYSGAGYFLTVRHPLLPQERSVLSEPVVIGRCEEIEAGYLVFIENRELMLECYTAGSVEVPPDFRDSNVRLANDQSAP